MMDIDDLTYDELVALNHQVVDRLKRLDCIRSQTAMLDFRIGERVCFESRNQGVITGTLVKLNQKTVSVVTDDGHQWNVSPSLVSRIAERELSPPSEGKIIDIDEGRTA